MQAADRDLNPSFQRQLYALAAWLVGFALLGATLLHIAIWGAYSLLAWLT